MIFRKEAYQPCNAAAATPAKRKKIHLCERFLTLIFFHGCIK